MRAREVQCRELSAIRSLFDTAEVRVRRHGAERQLEIVQDQARTAFEDDLSREYRSIVGALPADAFYTDGRTDFKDETNRAFYQYFDLSNEQLFHMRTGRVSSTTGKQWRDGIRGNLSLRTFMAAWDALEPNLHDAFFEDLRAVIGEVRGPAVKNAPPHRT